MQASVVRSCLCEVSVLFDPALLATNNFDHLLTLYF